MLSREDYIRMSLGLNLFFLRIMKEHSLFIKAAFTCKNISLIETAAYFIRLFEGLLQEATQLSDGVLPQNALRSGQYFTQFTLDAEKVTQFYTGIMIDSSITMREASLQPAMTQSAMAGLEGSVNDLNQRALAAVAALASFKSRLLTDVLSCRLFTNAYPLLIDHVMREAVFYQGMLMKLQNRVDFRTAQDLVDQEAFWNRIMAEHSKFIRGLLDPTENDLFNAANMFGHQFDELTAQAQLAQTNMTLAPKSTADSLNATLKLRDFKAAGTSGILNCKVRSIILPLLGDHVLREANHYAYLLQTGE